MIYRKKLSLVFSLFLFTLSTTFAQSEASPAGGLKITKIDFSLGFETDFVKDMDYNFFVNQMPEAQQARLDQLNFAPADFYSGVCENPSINVGLTLEHPRLKNIEWRNAFAYKPDRVDAVSYYNNSEFSGEYINIDATHAEYTLESALIYRASIYNILNFYGGVGTNIGVTSSNQTCVFTSLDLTATDISYTNVEDINDQANAGYFDDGGGFHDCFDTGMQYNQRAFLQGGAGIVFFKRVELGMNVKYGIGFRADFGQTIDRTKIVAVNLSARYLLH